MSEDKKPTPVAKLDCKVCHDGPCSYARNGARYKTSKSTCLVEKREK